MTCKEKLNEMHPDHISVKYVAGCLGCPHQYGILSKPEYCESETNPYNEKMCEKCWNREIPEEDDDVNINNLPYIKDSGARREFETGAVRDIQEGKGRCDLMPLDIIGLWYKTRYGANRDEYYVFESLGKFVEFGDHLFLCSALSNVNMSEDPSTMFLEVSKHFEEGCKKYGENNWQKGIPTHCYIDSAVRHYLKYLRGDKDEPHDRAFCWNILCCIWTCIHKPELNDYRKKENNNDT